MRHLGVVLLAGLTGCKVVDAPEAMEDLVVFAFTSMDDERASEVAANDLPAMMDRHAEQLAEGFRVGSLTKADLEAAGVGSDVESGIVGVAATIELAASMDELVAAWSYPHMEEVIETTLTFDITSEDGERGCFLDGACDWYAYDGTRELDMGLFGQATQAFTREFRRVELEDGGAAILVRELVPGGSQMTTDLVKVHQQFGFSAFYADGGGTKRLDTYWIDAEVVGVDLPDTFALDFAVDGMTKTAADVEAWIEAEL